MSSKETQKYEKILEGTVKESKKRIKKLESPDYGKIKELEVGGKDRKTLKKWLDKRIEEEERLKEKKEKKEEKLPKKTEKIKFLPEEEKVGEKKKKPRFWREEFHKIKTLKGKWRRPRGGDSKKRKQKRGKGKVPKIGYKNPEEKRGLVKGLKPKRIQNPSQLDDFSKEEGAIISGRVGRKKRNEIIKKANQLKIPILNPKKGEIK